MKATVSCAKGCRQLGLVQSDLSAYPLYPFSAASRKRRAIWIAKVRRELVTSVSCWGSSWKVLRVGLGLGTGTSWSVSDFFGGPSSLPQKFAGITTLFVKRTTWVLNGHLRRGKNNVFDTGHRGTGWSDPRGSFSGGPAGSPTGGTVSTADDDPADPGVGR